MIDNIKIEIVSGSNSSDELIESCYEVEKNCGGESYDKSDYYDIMKHPTNIHFIAYIDDIIRGILTINPISKKFGGCIYLINISVDKNYHRKSIATKLINKSIEYILSNNLNEVIYALEVDKNNLEAISLYKKVGFQINEKYTDYEQYCMNLIFNIKI